MNANTFLLKRGRASRIYSPRARPRTNKEIERRLEKTSLVWWRLKKATCSVQWRLASGEGFCYAHELRVICSTLYLWIVHSKSRCRASQSKRLVRYCGIAMDHVICNSLGCLHVTLTASKWNIISSSILFKATDSFSSKSNAINDNLTNKIFYWAVGHYRK